MRSDKACRKEALREAGNRSEPALFNTRRQLFPGGLPFSIYLTRSANQYQRLHELWEVEREPLGNDAAH
jgi:hypothetical protein